MKKIFIILLVLVFSVMMVAPCVLAGEKTIRVSWEQNIPPDFWGWKIYKGTTQGGPYEFLVDVLYTSGQTEFTSDQVIITPDEQVTTIYIVLISFDLSANPSGYSNEASAVIDFEPPEAAYSVTITVVTEP